MIFKTKKKEYEIEEGLRDRVKPGWQEMLRPAKARQIIINPYTFLPFVAEAERRLAQYGGLVGKKILEIGCNEGARCFLMAKYEDTEVHGIDVDEYTVDQSPDLNVWNPKDVEYVHGKFTEMRTELAKYFPSSVADKVTFETCDIANYRPYDGIYDVVISWDTLEHITNLPMAFKRMADCLYTGGIAYHEYNPFFSVNGGHSLCTLDILYGHCRLNEEDFERYVGETRPQETKIDLNFYHKCLNRATRADIRKLAKKNRFEILEFSGTPSFGSDTPRMTELIKRDILKEVQENYPTVTIDDLLCDSVQLILRKK